MSHVATVKTQMRSLEMLRRACHALDLPLTLGRQTVRTYSREIPCDASVQLPGWKYPVAIDVTSGEAHYDNYGGHWGDISRFQALHQEYALQVAEAEAEELIGQGYTLSRQSLDNGDVQLVLER